VSVTLEGEDAEALREFMRAAYHYKLGDAAGQILRLSLAALRREGAVNYVSNRVREAHAYQVEHPPAALADELPASAADLAVVVDLAQWRARVR